MKNNGSTFFKISGILSIIAGAIFCALSIVTFFITLGLGIPLIIGGNKIMRMADMDCEQIEQNKNSIIGWSIFFLIVNTISGVLSLIGIVMCESNNQTNQTNSNQNSQNQTQSNQNTTKTYNENEPSRTFENKAEKLERLLSLKERGVLSDEEFQALKEKILKED